MTTIDDNVLTITERPSPVRTAKRRYVKIINTAVTVEDREQMIRMATNLGSPVSEMLRNVVGYYINGDMAGLAKYRKRALKEEKES